MKTLLIALFVLASTVAGAVDTTPPVIIDTTLDCIDSGHCQIVDDRIWTFTCIDGFERKGTICVVKKGHCPHCGAKRVDSPAFWICRGNKYACSGPIDGEILFCPNGHVFWEK